MKQGFLVLLVAGTIDFIYKEASNTSQTKSKVLRTVSDSPLSTHSNFAVAPPPLPTTTSTAHAPHTHARSSSRRCAEPRGSY